MSKNTGKGLQLIYTFKNILQNEDTDCGEEILVSVLAYELAKNAVELLINEGDLKEEMLKEIEDYHNNPNY